MRTTSRFKELGPTELGHIAELKRHPGWAELTRFWEAKLGETARALLVSGPSADEQERAADYWRAVLDVLDSPRAAELHLEAAFKRAQE